MTIPVGGADPQAGRTGLVLRDALPWPQVRQVAETAEDTGYESVFVPEIAGREAFATPAGLANATKRIGLGTGVVAVRSRSASIVAMAAATLHDLSGGRAVLGLGCGAAAGRPGGAGPIALMEAYVRAVRAILAGETVGPDDRLGLSAFSLELPTPDPVPIWVAALGDRMIRLGGELADGVLLNWCTPERVRSARALVSQAAGRTNRDPETVTVAVYVRACLGVDEGVAMDALKEMTGRYAAIPHYRRQFDAMGLGEEAAIATNAFEAGRSDEVPERLVRAVAVTGGRREALQRFAAYREAGADLVFCYPVTALDPFSSLLGTALGAAPSPSLEA